jgi:hypothetical protein
VHFCQKPFVSLAALLFLLGAASSLHARQTQPRQGPPSSVLYFEPIEPVVAVGAEATDQQAAGQEKLEVSFHAFGRQFDLLLEPNDLFASGASNVWIGDLTTTTEAPTVTFYKGEVKGEPGSWVRVSLRDGTLDGMIWTKDEIYFVEPGTRFFAGAAPYATVMYRMSDTVSDWEPGSCALETQAVGFAMEGHRHAHNPFGDYESLKAELQAIASAGILQQLDLGIVADYEYYQEHGSASATDMQNVLNQIDGIYRAELGVTLHLTQTVVYTTSSDPFSSTTDPASLLYEFSNYKNNPANPVYGTGLAHLFTNRDLQGSVIGIAWIGTLCSNYYGTGLSQDFTTTNKVLVLLSAHEIGHNFNAPHDNQDGSACAATPFGFIMNPWLSTDLNLQFSECSKTQIAPEVAGASCLEPVSDDDPSCAFSISPSNRSHTAEAGEDSVAVTTTDGCSWTAASNTDWLTVTSGEGGSGNGTVTYAFGANPGPSSRSGTLTIAGKTFTVTQAAPCTYSLSRYSRTHRARRSSSYVKVYTSRSCGWTAQSNVDWITITSNTSGTGTKTIWYTVATNTTGSPRTGTLTIAGQTFTVTQKG